MRNKTYKLIKLERNRYSILTSDLKHCFICKKLGVDIHEIYGGRNRKVSMKNGLCVPLCREHHYVVTINAEESLKLKKMCQEEFEKTHTRNDWFNLIGKNYLDY